MPRDLYNPVGETTLDSIYLRLDTTNDPLTGDLTVGDDLAYEFGAPDAFFRWETADANANALNLTLPDGDATNVPVLVVGRESDIGNVDLALFDGITVPTLAIMNDSATDGVKIYTETFGAAELTTIESIAGNIALVPSFAASPSVNFGDGSLNVRFNIAGATSGQCSQTWREGASLLTRAQMVAIYSAAQFAVSLESQVGRSFFVGTEGAGNTGPSSKNTGAATQTDPMFSVLSATDLGTDTGEVANMSFKGLRCGTADNADFDSSAFSMSSDRAAYDFTISAVSALAAAAVNQNGGNLILQAGDNASGGGSDGTVQINGYTLECTNGATTNSIATFKDNTVTFVDILDGFAIDIFESTGTEKMTINHDGTDLRFKPTVNNAGIRIENDSDTNAMRLYYGNNGVISVDGNLDVSLSQRGGIRFIQASSSTGTPTAMIDLTGGTHTAMTASTEMPDIDWDFSNTKTWATGAITDQRDVKIQARTYAFAGASTITNASTFYVDDAPTAGTNATITNAYAVFSDAGLNRFDGDGSHVFELPADATDPTGGGGAATGRIPVVIGGVTRYLAYY